MPASLTPSEQALADAVAAHEALVKECDGVRTSSFHLLTAAAKELVESSLVDRLSASSKVVDERRQAVLAETPELSTMNDRADFLLKENERLRRQLQDTLQLSEITEEELITLERARVAVMTERDNALKKVSDCENDISTLQKHMLETDEKIEELKRSEQRRIAEATEELLSIRMSTFNWGAALPVEKGRANAGNIIFATTFSPNGRWLVVDCVDALRVYDASKGLAMLTTEAACIRHQDHKYIRTISFSRDSSKLAVSSQPSSVTIYDTSNQEDPKQWAIARTLYSPAATITPPATPQTVVVQGVAVSPTSDLVAAACGDGRVRIWNIETGVFERVITAHTTIIYTVAFSVDGKYLATACDDRLSHVYRVSDGVLVMTLRGHEDPLRTVAFSPDNKYIMTGAKDGRVRVWGNYVEPPTTTTTTTTTPGTAAAVTSPVLGTCFQTFTNPRVGGQQAVTSVYQIIFSRFRKSARAGSGSAGAGASSATGGGVEDYCMMTVGADSNLRIYRMGTPASARAVASVNPSFSQVQVMKAHDGMVRAVAMTPDNQYLVSGGDERNIKLFSI